MGPAQRIHEPYQPQADEKSATGPWGVSLVLLISLASGQLTLALCHIIIGMSHICLTAFSHGRPALDNFDPNTFVIRRAIMRWVVT